MEGAASEIGRDQIDDWTDELMDEIEVSLARHAEFVRLYPVPAEDGD